MWGGSEADAQAADAGAGGTGLAGGGLGRVGVDDHRGRVSVGELPRHGARGRGVAVVVGLEVQPDLVGGVGEGGVHGGLHGVGIVLEVGPGGVARGTAGHRVGVGAVSPVGHESAHVQGDGGGAVVDVLGDEDPRAVGDEGLVVIGRGVV